MVLPDAAAGPPVAVPEDVGEGSGDAEEPDESAHATPCPVAIAAPIPSATANPPTRPTYAPEVVTMAPSVGLANSKHDRSGRTYDLPKLGCLRGRDGVNVGARGGKPSH